MDDNTISKISFWDELNKRLSLSEKNKAIRAGVIAAILLYFYLSTNQSYLMMSITVGIVVSYYFFQIQSVCDENYERKMKRIEKRFKDFKQSFSDYIDKNTVGASDDGTNSGDGKSN